MRSRTNHSQHSIYHPPHLFSKFDRAVAYLIYHSGLVDKKKPAHEVLIDVHIAKGKIKSHLESIIDADMAKIWDILQFGNAFCGYAIYAPQKYSSSKSEIEEENYEHGLRSPSIPISEERFHDLGFAA